MRRGCRSRFRRNKTDAGARLQAELGPELVGGKAVSRPAPECVQFREAQHVVIALNLRPPIPERNDELPSRALKPVGDNKPLRRGSAFELLYPCAPDTA